MTTTETPWSVRPESMDPCGGGVQASTNMSLVGSNRGNTNTSGSEPMQNSSMNSRASLGSIMGSQSRHGRKRSFSPRIHLFMVGIRVVGMAGTGSHSLMVVVMDFQ